MQRLKNKVVLVTGASRGVGQGIARVLGEAGATVYVTGRSTREAGPTACYDEQGEPVAAARLITIDETAELVTARGGTGIPVRCDHTDDAQVEALFARIGRESGRLDILVNNVWGGYENMETYSVPFWEQPGWRWNAMFDAASRAHFMASRRAVPLMFPQNDGLIITTTYRFDPNTRPHHIVEWSKWCVNGLIPFMAHHLRKHNIASVGLAPIRWAWSGQTLQEVTEALQTGDSPETVFRQHPELLKGESAEYSGRATAALATDPYIMTKSGGIFTVDDLAREYGFTDIGNRIPAYRDN